MRTLLFAGLACITAACGPAPAAAPSATEPPGTAPSTEGSSSAPVASSSAGAGSATACDAETPVGATQGWLNAVERGSWTDFIACMPPDVRERAQRELSTKPADKLAARMSELQVTAAKVRTALSGQASFVKVAPVLAEPAQLEWYYCGEPPPGEMFASRCAVSVVEKNGRYYVRRVTDH